MGIRKCFTVKRVKGFTLVEMIFSLMITTLTLSLLVEGMVSLSHLKQTDKQNEDIILFAYQLQHELMSAQNIQLMDEQTLSYEVDQKMYIISLDRQRIVKKEGYEILLFDVDKIHFKMDDLIYLDIYRNQKCYTKIIGIKRLNYG